MRNKLKYTREERCFNDLKPDSLILIARNPPKPSGAINVIDNYMYIYMTVNRSSAVTPTQIKQISLLLNVTFNHSKEGFRGAAADLHVKIILFRRSIIRDNSFIGPNAYTNFRIFLLYRKCGGNRLIIFIRTTF